MIKNISHRIVNRLHTFFEEAKHVRDFNLQYASDREIWNFAKNNNFSIVTFDADFYELVALFGHPPKIVWLRFGNTLTQHLANKPDLKKEVIKTFLEDDAYLDIATLEIDD